MSTVMESKMSILHLVETIIHEISEDPVLASCRSFSELHNHCDANCLGKQEHYLESYGDDSFDMISKAQEIVDATLRTMNQ